MRFPSIRGRGGFSIVGLLITVACMVVLFSILMTSLNKRVTGEGSAQPGTVRSFQDQLYLDSIFKSMLTHAADQRGRFITPSQVAGQDDASLNTTANLYSAMVMADYVPCKQLVSGNEFSTYVTEMHDYDRTIYNPQLGVHWDPNFKADLRKLSHASFAHMPMFGERFVKGWKDSLNSATALLGNRGPLDGREDPRSLTYGRNGRWGGHVLFGDGHVEFVETFTPPSVTLEVNGKRHADNLFFMDLEAAGDDAILAFTREMKADGPVLQFD